MKNKSSDLTSIFERYWRAYGGCKAVIGSPYTIFSAIFSGFLYPLWIDNDLSNVTLDILPNLLGFTLGGYAMFLAFGDRDFLKILTQSMPDGHSIYRGINSTFVHFITVQISAMLWAIFTKAWGPYIEWFPLKLLFFYPQSFLFIYAILLALAVTFNLFRFTNWYEKALINKPLEKSACRCSNAKHDDNEVK